MDTLRAEAARHRVRQEDLRALATQTAALFLATGIDLSDTCALPARDRERIACGLQRLIERERMKGARSHWSYDLGRHIALKQALDRIQAVDQ